MFSTDIQDIKQYKVPKYIDDEYKLLDYRIKDNLREPCEIPNFQEYIRKITDGLETLQELWNARKASRKMTHEHITEKDEKLIKCREMIDQIIQMQSNWKDRLQNQSVITLPALLSDETDKFTSRDLFPSEEERSSTVEACLTKLSTLASKRSQWIQEGMSSDLDMCQCAGSENRAEMENDLLLDTIIRYPPHPDLELSVMSLGSGNLLQDWILLQQFADVGYKKIHLHFVDPRTTDDKVEAFKRLIKNTPSLSAKVSIVHSQCFFNEVPACRRFHCIHAMDFDGLGFASDATDCWKTLINATRCLKEDGVVFCSAFKQKYLFDARVNEWKIPCKFSDEQTLIKCQPEADVHFACTNLEYFWQATFYRLASLVKMQARNIHVELIKPNEKSWVLKNIPTIQQLSQQILSPNNHTQISFSVQSTPQKDWYDIMCLGDQLIDSALLDSYIPMVKQGGAIIINPHGYLRNMRIDTLQQLKLQTILRKKVSDSFQTMEAYAKALASSRSINIQVFGAGLN